MTIFWWKLSVIPRKRNSGMTVWFFSSIGQLGSVKRIKIMTYETHSNDFEISGSRSIIHISQQYWTEIFLLDVFKIPMLTSAIYTLRSLESELSSIKSYVTLLVFLWSSYPFGNCNLFYYSSIRVTKLPPLLICGSLYLSSQLLGVASQKTTCFCLQDSFYQ